MAYPEFAHRISFVGKYFAPQSVRKQVMSYLNVLTNEMIMASGVEIPSEKEDNQVLDHQQTDTCSVCVTVI